MALIAVNRITNGRHLVEDPITSRDRIFIAQRGHTSSTLTPLFDKEFTFGSTEFILTDYLFSNVPNINPPGGAIGRIWLLNGTIVTGGPASTADDQAWMDYRVADTYHSTLDFANYPARGFWRTANNRCVFSAVTNYNTPATAYSQTPGYGPGTTGNYYVYFDDITKGFQFSGPTGPGSSGHANHFFWEDATNGKLWAFCNNWQPQPRWTFFTNYDGTTPTAGSEYSSGTANSYDSNFFLGTDNLGYVYILQVRGFSADAYWIYSFTASTSTPTQTNVVQGVTPSSPTTGQNYRVFPSNIRRKNSTARIFYSSHYDVNGNLKPLCFTWNPSTQNSFGIQNCNTFYAGSNVHSTYATRFTNSGSSNNDGRQHSYHIKPWQFTSGANNYISFWLTDKAPNISSGARWPTSAARTMLSFQIDVLGDGNHANLTFHSAYTFNAIADMPRDILPVNSAGTQLAVPSDNKVSFFSWDNTNGWSISSIYPVGFYMIGLDQYNRIWGTGSEFGRNTYHIITPTLPVTFALTMANGASTFTYAGANVSTSVLVNAYDYTGARIATTINLVIDGNSMLFTSTGNNRQTITTSNTADTNVALTIYGGGISSIIANANI